MTDGTRKLIWVVRAATLLLIVLAAFSLRAHKREAISAYMDETIHVVYGRMFLVNEFEEPLDQPLRWTFGWYLWPVMAATAERLGGLPAVRLLAAVLGALTVLAVYGFARRVYVPKVGFAAAFLFAVVAPAVFVFRVATRDSATLFFFAVGLWLFVRAWQEQERLTWLAAAVAFFAAFLCKYVVAIYFPLLALASLLAARPEQEPSAASRSRGLLYFAFPLAALCGLYIAVNLEDLTHLVQYGREYKSLQGGPGEAWRIYVKERLDFWALAVLAFFGWRWRDGSIAEEGPRAGRVVVLLWLGVVLTLLFQWWTRADANWWKHVNYALVFLVPIAANGILRVVRWVAGQEYFPLAVLSVLVAGILLGFLGGSWEPQGFTFWPNTKPILMWIEGRLHPQHRVLVDDAVFRYYFRPPLDHQSRIVDPFWLEYRSPGASPGLLVGAPAYTQAVRDGYFDFIVLNGGIAQEARTMRQAIAGVLNERYELQVLLMEPVRGGQFEIYERIHPPVKQPPEPTVRVEVTSPTPGEVLRPTGPKGEVEITGIVRGAVGEGSWWKIEGYPQPKEFNWAQNGPLEADGAFRVPLTVGPVGRLDCNHILRVSAYDAQGRLLASTGIFVVTRVNPDGTWSLCR
jgi:hypothetical protein